MPPIFRDHLGKESLGSSAIRSSVSASGIGIRTHASSTTR